MATPGPFRVYVDESGDRGLKETSSDYFIVSAVIVPDASDKDLRMVLRHFKLEAGRPPNAPLHFRKLSHNDRRELVARISSVESMVSVNVVIAKRFLGTSRDQTAHYIRRPDSMYLYALRLLLERISWYCDEHGHTPALVTIAHLKNFRYQRLRDYELKLWALGSGTQIRWPMLMPHPLRISSPDAVENLQAADAAASSILPAIGTDRWGRTEGAYLDALRARLYRRGGARVTSYGLKVFPREALQPGSPIARLSDL